MEEKIQEFLNFLNYELNYSDKTINSYEIEINKFNNYLSKNKIKYNHVSKEHIKDYLKELDKHHYKNSSVSKNLSSLRSFYKYLNNNSYIENNPFTIIGNPKKEKLIPQILNPIEIEDMINLYDYNDPVNLRSKLILELLYSTGLRVSELVNVKLNDINFSDNTIRVLGKGSKERIVLFGSKCLTALNNYIKNSRNTFLQNKRSDYLILNKFGNQLSVRSVEILVKDSCEKLAIKHKVTPHTIRHTFASHLLNNGADIKSVQELLGHESLSTTQIYTHLTNDRIRDVYLKTHPHSKK